MSLTPISSDNATPSPSPDVPSLVSLLWHSGVLGFLLSGQTLLFFYRGQDYFGVNFHSDDKWCKDYEPFKCCHEGDTKYCTEKNFKYLYGSNMTYYDDGTDWSGSPACTNGDVPSSLAGHCGHFYQETLTYIQISIAVEFLIFSTRTTGAFFLSKPSLGLIAGVMGANILVSIFAVTPTLWNGDDRNEHTKSVTDYPNGSVSWGDLGYIWTYDIVWLFITDVVKMLSFWALGELADGELDPGGDVLPQDIAMLQIDDARVSTELKPKSPAADIRSSLNRASLMSSRSSYGSRASVSAADRGRVSTVRASMGNSLRPRVPGNMANLLR